MTALPEPIQHTCTAMMEAYATTRKDEERTYLGASVIGEECERNLWYSMRWCSPPEVLDGRKIYLFDTGHVEEARMIAALKATPGLTVIDRGADGKQLGFEALGGHFRGHWDGKALGVLEAPTVWHIVEVKTHKASSARAVSKHGVLKEAPKHVIQANIYMHYEGLRDTLYLFENKDDSHIETQRFKYDAVLAAQTIAKAERVICSSVPLPKLHEDPTAKMAFRCGYCQHKPVCHEGQFARVNCRTCISSTPVEGGWHCDFHDIELDVETQRLGCSNHVFLPPLVPGQQIDSDDDKRTVTYVLKTGAVWVDGVVG